MVTDKGVLDTVRQVGHFVLSQTGEISSVKGYTAEDNKTIRIKIDTLLNFMVSF